MRQDSAEADVFRSVQSFAQRHWTRFDVEHGASLGRSGSSRWRALTALGLQDIALPGSLGGMADEPALVAAGLRSAGHALLPEELISHAAAAWLLAKLEGGEALKAQLPAGCRLGLLSPSAGDGIELRNGRLYGAGDITAGAAGADAIVLRGRDQEGPAWCFAKGDDLSAALRSVSHYTDGEAHHQLRVDGTNAQRIAPATAELCEQLELLETALRLCYAAGVLEATASLTGRYTRDRKQFGRSLESFQAVQERLSRLVMSSVTATWWAETAISAALTGDPQARSIIALAAGFAALNLEKSMLDAHQVHGGMGFAKEYDLHLFTRRAYRLRARLQGAGSSQLIGATALAARAHERSKVLAQGSKEPVL